MKKQFLLVLVVAALAGALAAYFLIQSMEDGGEVVEITLYAGEINNQSVYAYGLSRENLTSPGPTVRVKVGDLVRIKLVNVGVLPHVLAVSGKVEENPNIQPVFENAEVGSVLEPVLPGESGMAVFKPNRAGRFYYLCTIPGHVSRGMYGVFVVEPR